MGWEAKNGMRSQAKQGLQGSNEKIRKWEQIS